MIIPIIRARLPDLDSIKDKFARALYQGHVTNNGEHVRRFERHLSDYLRAPALTFCNGQSALITMLMSARIKPYDEVICPAFTFAGTAHAIAMLGATPVFADIDAHTLTLDPADVVKKITPRTVAILGVDVYGICCDYKTLTAIARDQGLLALFDSAPAFGSMVGAFPTGNFGDVQIFSFHATKPMTTCEGGCLSTNNAGLFERAKVIRDFGQTEERDCISVGLNGKMMEVCALIGLDNLKDWREYRHKRTFKAAELHHVLFGVKGIRPLALTLSPDVTNPNPQWPIWCYFPIFVEPEFGKSRDDVLAYLHSKNVMARKYYAPPLHHTKPYANGGVLPVTEKIAAQVIALPLYADMLPEEMQYIADTLDGARK